MKYGKFVQHMHLTLHIIRIVIFQVLITFCNIAIFFIEVYSSILYAVNMFR